MKKFLVVFVILAFIVTAGIIYLNKMVLPKTVYGLVVKGLEQSLGRRVELGSVSFNLLKGLILRELVVYDRDKKFLSVEEVSCAFLIPPIFKKVIVIPRLSVRSAELFLERDSGNNLNIQRFISSLGREGKGDPGGKFPFSVSVYRVSLGNSAIYLRDGVLPEGFNRDIKNLNADFYLTLPASARFNLSSDIEGINGLKASGEFKILKKELELDVSLGDFSLDGTIVLHKGLIDFSKIKADYLNSRVILEGVVDISSPDVFQADIKGVCNLNLGDVSGFLPEEAAKRMRPGGMVFGELDISGNLKEPNFFQARGKFSAPTLSFYGFKGEDFSLDYNQAGGLIDIPLVSLSFYGGLVKAGAKIDLISGGLPYLASVDLNGVKLENLKEDTAFKAKSISGKVKGNLRLTGEARSGLSGLSGEGELLAEECRLWELDLFKGIGRLIFAQDFSSVVFDRAYCDFSIQDEHILSDSLELKSNVTDLTGSFNIGFDKSIDASINIEALEELISLKDEFKNIISIITGEEGHLGAIRITGTLDKPKYKFKPVAAAIGNIIEGFKKELKDILFGD